MNRQATPRTASAVEILKQDHASVKGLFARFMETGERAFKSRQRLADELFAELELHTTLEEEIFYPAYKEAAREQGEEIVAESLEEHHVVDLLISELKALSPEDETFEPKMKVLCENVQHHIEEEEAEMLAKARRLLGPELESLGRKMQERRRQLETGS